MIADTDNVKTRARVDFKVYTTSGAKLYRAVPNEPRSQFDDEHYREWVDEQSIEDFDAFDLAPIAGQCMHCGEIGLIHVSGGVR